MASKEVRKRFRHRTTTDAERKLTRARWNKLNPRIRIGHIQMKRWLYIKEKCCISSHDKVAELLINTWICYTGEVINEDSGTQSKPAKLAKTHKKTKRNVSSDHSTQAKLNEIPSQSTPAASGSILPEIESNNGISEISRDQRKDNSSPNPTISLPVTSSGDFAELKESSPPLPEPVIETDYAEDDAYNVSPYKEQTTESNNEEQDNSGITLQLEVESGDATEEQVSVKEEPVWDEGYTTTVSQSENSNSCHDRNMSVGQSWQLSNSTNEESTITTEIKKENESDEPQQERVVPVPIMPPTQQTTLPVLVTWPVPTNLVKNKVQLGPDGSAQNALLQKLKAVVQQNQQKATGQVPTVTQRTNQILVPIQSLSGTTIQLPISVHTPPTSQQLYSVQQTRPIVHLQPSTIVQQTRPIVQLQPSTIVQQTRPIVQLQPSAILSFQQPAPQRSTETTQVLASTSTSATAQASGSLSTNEQFLNPQLIKTEPTPDQSAGSGEPPVVPSTSTQQEEVDTGQSDSNDISEDEPKKKRFKSVQINTDEEGTSLGKSTIKNTRWGVKILQESETVIVRKKGRKRKNDRKTRRKDRDRKRLKRRLELEEKVKEREKMFLEYSSNNESDSNMDNNIKPSSISLDEASLNRLSAVFGSFHQGCKMFSEESRGRQCTCISLTMLAKKDNLELTSDFIDSTLIEGDSLYKTVIQDLHSSGQFNDNYLLFNELPTLLSINDARYHVTKLDVITGVVLPNNESEGCSLEDGLRNWAECADSGLILVNGFCSAIFRFMNQFWYFDSHSHSDNGMTCVDGKAVLVHFDSIVDLIFFLHQYYASIDSLTTIQFEILPVIIENTTRQNCNNETVVNEPLNGSDNTCLALSKDLKRLKIMREYFKQKYGNAKTFRNKKKMYEQRRYYRSNKEFQEYKKRVKNKEKYRNDKDYKERMKARCKERYKNDKEYQMRKKARSKEKYKNDKDYQERMKARSKERYRSDKKYQEYMKARSKERYKNDKKYQEYMKARSKERYKNDKDYKERMKAKSKEKYKSIKELKESKKNESKEKQSDKELQESKKEESKEIQSDKELIESKKDESKEIQSDKELLESKREESKEIQSDKELLESKREESKEKK